VDALRMDAIPYICERDGTSCENLPETHGVIKRIRAAIDEGYANRLILAEANQWPADVRPYFGEGDECHMAFHFPLMPRIYMALRQEDRLPITDIMAQTPPIPDICQWALFLRNHDELTLEMVTDDERDYMYLAYSTDPRMRVNVGIRRRLAPLVDNNRRRIELLNSLLLSFPGTPVIYYGDELGMGDNIYLGDRNGVRTPMQWNSDRNAGFSRCDPARLYFPVVMDPIYGYQVINVEAQLSDQSSLLHWTRNMIALRKLFQVFGRGTLRFLNPANRKVLAYLRELDSDDGTRETVLCVANLSRFAQPASLDLGDYVGAEPVEMLGYVPFPTVTADPYAITLAPYSFLWLELQPAGMRSEAPPLPEPQAAAMEEVLAGEPDAEELFANGWEGLLSGRGQAVLQNALVSWLPRQRWFGSKSRRIQSARVSQWVEIPKAGGRGKPGSGESDPSSLAPVLLFVEIDYADGPCETYQLPLAAATGEEADELNQNHAQGVLASFTSSAGPIVLFDATHRENLRQGLLALIEENATLEVSTAVKGDAGLRCAQSGAETGSAGSATPVPPQPGVAATPVAITAQPGEAAAPPRDVTPPVRKTAQADGESLSDGPELPPASRLEARASDAFATHGSSQLTSRVGSAEQSNSSILYGNQLILKLFRRLHVGENPDVEVGRFLTEVAHFPRIAPFLGEIALASPGGEKITTAMLQGLVANQGDGWKWFLDELSGYFEAVAGFDAPAEIPAASFSSRREPPPQALEYAGRSLDAAALLGQRTAEMHLALATPTGDAAFAAEPFTADDLARDAHRIDEQITSTLEALKTKLSALKDLTADQAALLLSRRIDLFARANSICDLAAAGRRIRIHGDYHLGQTLRTADPSTGRGDFVLLDFEGEPARPLVERRQKQSPLKDVAGMLRSFSYAAYTGLDRRIAESPGDGSKTERLAQWAVFWQNSASSAFLRAYRAAVAAHPALLPSEEQSQTLLRAYLLEKALYELLYELNNRPAWLRIPLSGILNL
jgi:maltose alpha-D-glucosyltransferase / alpha-amylase